MPITPRNQPAVLARLPAALALLAGLVLCILLWRDFGLASQVPGVTQAIVAGIVALLVSIPGVAASLNSRLDRLRHPTPVQRRVATCAIFAAAAFYLAATAWFHARDLFPRLHDEQSYLLQARMLAHARLWEPSHPLADFFESFHILVRPVYASIYFPGTALLNVPAIWLGLPSWIVPVLLAGAVLGLTYRVTTELLDGVAGLVAAMLVIAVPMFRITSTLVMAQMPAAFFGLLLIWCWLRWRRKMLPRWALLAGAIAGWAAITRPVDALAFALPIAVAMVWTLCRQRGGSSRPRHILPTVIAGILGAIPFLALQAYFNVSVTGSVFETPYVAYLKINQPGTVFGESTALRPDGQPVLAPETSLPQKRDYYRQMLVMEAVDHQEGRITWFWERCKRTLEAALASPLLLLLLPAAFLGLRDMRWTVFVPVLLFFALYLLNPFYLPHYSVPLIAPMAFASVLGAHVLLHSIRSSRFARPASAILQVSLLAIALVALPELRLGDSSGPTDELFPTPLLDTVEQTLRGIETPAVVFFRYGKTASVHEEPVYNSDVVSPDDGPIIRAHDLGPQRDLELIRYYAERQPARRFYLFDRETGKLTELGSASEAEKQLRTTSATAPADRKGL